MSRRDTTLDRILQAVADRIEVDWEAEVAARPDLAASLASLRDLQGVAEFSKHAPEAPPPSETTRGAVPRARARSKRRTWGHLEILESIGRGGFGEVFRAYDPRLQMEYALKLALPRRGRTLDAARFLAEARSLARVRHPNVVAVYGADEHDGRIGLWTELIRGLTLEEQLEQRGPFGAREAALVGIELCRALAALHVVALVHRDVKTANVMREHGGRVVLMDFGAVWKTGSESGSALGTPAFMAPEVLAGTRPSARGDLYGLGVVLYRLVTAAHPYLAETVAALREQQGREAAIALRDRRPDLPYDFITVVERALAVRPEARYPSAGSLEHALAAVIAGTAAADAEPVRSSAVECETPNNLPRPSTSFIGRAREISACVKLIGSARLVTLTGPGGSGKTRLAVRVAEQLLPEVEEARFVDLAPFDARRVPHAVGATLGIRESPRPLLDRIAERIGSRRMLVVLDNCEHVREACVSLVPDLLDRCQGLRVVATSREALRVATEHRFLVPPLSLPDPASLPDAVNASDAVRLFIERARAVRPDFRMTGEVAGALADVCRRLDGIPLALELAAARVRLLSVEELKRLLDHRFRLLTQSPFSSLHRHQTLRAALDWSYDHLDDVEKRLFRRLAAFAGGWTLTAALAIDGGEPDELSLVDILSRLVDKSLVVVDASSGAHSRFRMLETIREFASELLEAAGESDATRDRHASHFLALAEDADRGLWGSDQASSADWLEAEHQNLLAALSWCSSHDRACGLRLAGALGRFWAVRAHLTVGRDALRTALEVNPYQGPHPDVSRACYGAGVLAAFQMDAEDAQTLCSRSLEMCRVLGDRAGGARALVGLGLVAHNADEYDEARRLYGEALDSYRALGDSRGAAMVLNNLGGVAWRQGRWDEARTLHEKALAHAREIRDSDVLGLALTNLGFVAVVNGDSAGASERLLEALALTRDAGLRRIGVAALEVAAALFASCFESARAARLYAAAAALRESLGVPMDTAWRAAHAPWVDGVGRDLGAVRLPVEQGAGRGLAFEAAVAEAAKGLELLDTGGRRRIQSGRLERRSRRS